MSSGNLDSRNHEVLFQKVLLDLSRLIYLDLDKFKVVNVDDTVINQLTIGLDAIHIEIRIYKLINNYYKIDCLLHLLDFEGCKDIYISGGILKKANLVLDFNIKIKSLATPMHLSHNINSNEIGCIFDQLLQSLNIEESRVLNPQREKVFNIKLFKIGKWIDLLSKHVSLVTNKITTKVEDLDDQEWAKGKIQALEDLHKTNNKI